MKGYRIYSKIIIVVCFCFMLATILNFFTGMINSSLSGSSHILCTSIFCGVIFWTVAEEHRRFDLKQKK